MIVNKLKREDVSEVYKFIEKDFPPDERKPLAMMLSAFDAGNYDGFGLYENDEILGYAFFYRIEKYYLLDYLAIVEEKRNNMLGSRFLKQLCEQIKPDETIVGELENEKYAIDEEEKTLRIRRTNFYLRNGFTDTLARSFLYGVHYKIIEFSKVRHTAPEMEKIYCELYKAMLPEKLYVKYLTIEKQ